MLTWVLAKKDLLLLLRDPRALALLIAMPLIFILIMGLALGEGFGQKPEDHLWISILDRDDGYVKPAAFREGTVWLQATPATGAEGLAAIVASQLASQQFDRTASLREGLARLARTPGAAGMPSGVDSQELAVLFLATANQADRVPRESWSEVVRRDLDQTAGVRVEMIGSREQAERLVRNGDRAAVLVFGPQFSERVAQCSFLADGINPFYRDGVNLRALDIQVLRDPTQIVGSSIIEQVVQVSMLRVVLPWMIGRAFLKLGDPSFIGLMGERVHLDVPLLGRTKLATLLKSNEHKRQVGEGIKRSLSDLFPKYDLTGLTWATLTKSNPGFDRSGGSKVYQEDGSGFLRRGARRYQLLVPSNLVTFSFFLVLTLGWLFVAERRQGTLKRLRAAPISRGQILLGKLLPCLFLSVGQGLVLLAAGKAVFGMSWGPEPLWLFPLVFATSLAAMGLALLVASLARTETQVSIYGTLLVLVLALVSGCLWPRELMPDQVKRLSRITPHAWALDAYNQLLLNPMPNYAMVVTSCAVLTAFGVAFIALAWWSLRLD